MREDDIRVRFPCSHDSLFSHYLNPYERKPYVMCEGGFWVILRRDFQGGCWLEVSRSEGQK